MSSVGAVPGYAYPAFSYAESELLLEHEPDIIFPGAGVFADVIYTVGGGDAAYVAGIFAAYVASPAVGTRFISAAILDGDGAQINSFACPANPIANAAVTMSWNVELSTAYTLTGQGYSPWEPLVLPPGYSIELFSQGVQAGDKIVAITIKGLRIPAMGTNRDSLPIVPAPLFL